MSLKLAAEVAIIQHLTCRCNDSAVWSRSDTLVGSVEHERTLERKKGWACGGLEFFLFCESETAWREDKQQKREKKPWAGRFKAASQSCWSGGSASVWSRFSPAGAAEQHASSSSCYPTFSSVTSLPYSPSPPLPLTHLCAEGRSISTCDIPTQERGRARER